MPFTFNRYSGLLLIFFVHGLVYALLLLHRGRQQERRADYWLAVFLFLAVLFICPWMLGFAGWYEGDICFNCRNIMFYVPMQHSLFMGPVIYFYLNYLFRPSYQFTKKDGLHFLPGVLYLLWSLIVVIVDRVIVKKYYLMNGYSDPDLDDWYVAAGFVSLFIYLVASLRLYRSYRHYMVQQTSYADAVTFRWVQHFLVAFAIYIGIALFFHSFWLMGIDLDYIGAWWYYLFFSLIFYFIAIKGYSNSIAAGVRAGWEPAQTTTVELKPAPIEIQPTGESVAQASPEIESWKKAIYAAVVEERLYTNPALTLADLSRHLGTTPAVVSRTINAGFGMNFNDFINSHRVAEVKRRLEGNEAVTVTIMSIAYDAGFNSKATFNRAFKKFTGGNPTDFGPQDQVKTSQNLF